MAADSFAKAATALQDYAHVVTWAQDQAEQAIRLFARGRQASEQARAAYNRQVDTFNAAALSGERPAPLAPFSDPGQADVATARDMLDAARRQRDSAAQQAQHEVDAATSAAPEEPSGMERIVDEITDDVGMIADFHGRVLMGALEGVESAYKFARTLDPHDPYNVTHPAQYLDGVSNTLAGLLHSAVHPVDLIKGLVGAGWGSDPAEALGKLIPNVALGMLTDGASTAESAAARVATGAAERDAAVVAEQAATADAGSVGARSAEAGSTTIGYGDGPPWDGPSFGPKGTDYTPPEPSAIEPSATQLSSHTPSYVEPDDLYMSSVFEHAGDGLGNVEHEIDSLSGLSTHTESAAPIHVDSGPTTPVHEPPKFGTGGPAGEQPTGSVVPADVASTAAADVDLAKLPENVAWRKSSEPLYRVDGRHPIKNGIFGDGFLPRNAENLNLENYVGFNNESGFVSTTRKPEFWREANGRWYYEIDASGGIDVNATIGPHSYAGEEEIAMVGGVRPERIRGAWEMKVDPATGQRTLGDWIANPNYVPIG